MARQPSPRMRKVDELVREVVADAVRGLKDPRIGFVTITGARTSPDLRHAIVYYSALGTDEEQAATADGLDHARARIQATLGRETRLRYTPKLEFRVDESIDQGLRISQILREMEASGETDGSDAVEPPWEAGDVGNGKGDDADG